MPLPSPAAAGSKWPNIAVLPDGRFAMVWFEPGSDSSMALRFAMTSGRTWSRPATIAAGDSFFANWADVPSIRPLGGHRIAAHWLWRSGTGRYAYDVRLSQSDDAGRTWGPFVVPHRDGTATEHGFVSLVPEGEAVMAVWLDGRKTAGHDEQAHGPMPDMTLRSASISADGRLGDEAEIDGRTCDCCPTAAVTTDRGVLVAYRDRSADEVRDIVVTRRGPAGWSVPTPVHEDGWRIPGCPVNGPALAARGARVVVAWYSAAADSPQVSVAFSDDAGEHFAPPVRVDDGNPLGRVGVGLLPDGSTLVTWLEASGKDAFVRARRIPPDGAPAPAITVARTTAARASGYPRIAVSGGAALIAWTEAGRTSRVRAAMLRFFEP